MNNKIFDLCPICLHEVSGIDAQWHCKQKPIKNLDEAMRYVIIKSTDSKKDYQLSFMEIKDDVLHSLPKYESREVL